MINYLCSSCFSHSNRAKELQANSLICPSIHTFIHLLQTAELQYIQTQGKHCVCVCVCAHIWERGRFHFHYEAGKIKALRIMSKEWCFYGNKTFDKCGKICAMNRVCVPSWQHTHTHTRFNCCWRKLHCKSQASQPGGMIQHTEQELSIIHHHPSFFPPQSYSNKTGQHGVFKVFSSLQSCLQNYWHPHFPKNYQQADFKVKEPWSICLTRSQFL